MFEQDYQILYEGNVSEFETYLLSNAEQEIRVGKQALWCRIADNYIRQLSIIRLNPNPEVENEESALDETPPSLKHIIRNTSYNNFYRWGIEGGKTGNHRIIYAIHNYHKVILLHYFDKHYNGLIRREDIVPAEESYEYYCSLDPNLY